MLGVSSYSQDYVDACRVRVASQVAAYDRLIAAARAGRADDPPALDDAIDAFEHVFSTTMVLALDSSFCHRLRGKEGKDGNPLNEVRVLCSSLLLHDGAFTPDNGIRFEPDASILGYHAGDDIRMRGADFARIADAFFAELEKKFV
jgi:hypothetical protein